jgi:hypothetical protein
VSLKWDVAAKVPVLSLPEGGWADIQDSSSTARDTKLLQFDRHNHPEAVIQRGRFLRRVSDGTVSGY